MLGTLGKGRGFTERTGVRPIGNDCGECRMQFDEDICRAYGWDEDDAESAS